MAQSGSVLWQLASIIASALSGKEFIDPRGHSGFTERVGLSTGKWFAIEKGTCSDYLATVTSLSAFCARN